MRGCRARLRTGCLWAVVLFVGLVVLAGLAPDREEEVGAVAASPTAAGVAAVATDAPVMPSSTPEPTAVYEAMIRGAVDEVLRADQFRELFINDLLITVTWELSSWSVERARQDGAETPVELACALRAAGVNDRALRFVGRIGTVDAMGNEGEVNGVYVNLPPEFYGAINCGNTAGVNLPRAVSAWNGEGAVFQYDRVLLND